MLSYFQKKKLVYLFGLYDHNKNGFLQLEDFTDISDKICDLFGFTDESEKREKLVFKTVSIFHKLLKDIPHPENQVIQIEEWIQFFDKKVVNSGDEDDLFEYIELLIGYLFDLFDENRDGYISFDEYKRIFSLYGINMEYIEKSFINLDGNNDQRLSKNELTHAVEVFLTSDDPLMKENWIFGNWDDLHEPWLLRTITS